MKLEGSEKKLSSNELSEIETKFNIKLPQSFKEFYLEYNGGEPSHPNINGRSIQMFLSIKHGDEDDTIERAYVDYRSENLIRDLFIPFAFDGGGWPFCISVEKIGYGRVYLCPNGSINREPIFIANSFADLLSEASDEDDE